MSSPYYYPDTQVYRNRFDLRDPGLLAEAESIATAARVAELARQPVAGDLDFTYLQNIHHYLLQDVYDWAGEIRTVQTYAGDTGIPHDPPESIPDEAQRIFGELADANHLRGLSRDEFTTALAEHWGDLTSLHPFVDGNSRTQRLYVDQLARRAGWEIDWRAASAPAIQAARNIAFVDGGKILRDVLEPVIVPAGTVPAAAVTAPPRDNQMDTADHWRAMIEHLESTPNAPYTWASQHNRADHELADLAKLAASDFPSRPGAAISSTPRPTSTTSSRTTERTPNLGPGLER
ncbi:Fic family protein (plasmid) [Prescottella equi]|uniref:protein adenylyltransferase n=1 Tax=Rhodococcus hoagii TaxID=43767 RepID=A0A9Q2UQY8_RHOHA|nr:Fic family protein [Prescottella equi]AVR64945.1 Fic/Doc-like protein [Prescottella equi]MBM4487729.1 cell filamentation protein Fic [Prescottella equi]MBM4498409.1 cell filamentation protein Fic [Prescottella equi]MBM4507711.1 cell filamentation protein Fic [Prescottella equi]MBM4515018.1 cell filamentation protein Fic [Prescottella equi]